MKRNRTLTTTFLALALVGAAAHADSRWTLRERARFAALDRNHDGVVVRQEWPYKRSDFVHLDSNHDGVLAGAEIGMPVSVRNERPAQLKREEYFRMLDRNHDGWISRGEYDNTVLPFASADRDGNGYLSWTEWRDSRLGAQRNRPYYDTYRAYPDTYYPDYRNDRNVDTQRLHDFMDLDRNRDEYLTRAEWPASDSSFARLDRNRDGLIHINEYLGFGRY